MKLIPCTRGHSALVDDDDFERFGGVRWHAKEGRRGQFRPVRREGGRAGKFLYLHRAIMGEGPSGSVIDHINGDPWDNRKANLRFCSNAENVRNQRRPRKANGAGKGVHLRQGRWCPIITYEGTIYVLGGFASQLEAEIVYDAAALYLHGEFACLNHPSAGTTPKSPDELRAVHMATVTNRRPA